MTEPFANDWMRNVIAACRDSGPRRQADDQTEEFLREALFAVRPDEFRGLLTRIHDFLGFKLMLSCTDRTPLEHAVKQALCFADLVIVVPAPLCVSCASRESDRYAEFNYESIGRGGCWEAPVGVLQKVSRLLCKSMDAFDAGAVTFLPMLDELLYPSSDLNVSFSALPRPYSDSPGMSTRENAQLEAFYELCRERLIAEHLGAMHLNVLSFSRPVLGDFSVGKPTAQQPWSRSLIEIVLPDVSRFSIPDLLGFRRKAANSCAQFSTLIADLLKSQEARPKELVHASIASFSRQMEFTLQSNAPEQEAIAKANFVLGSGERNGGVMQAVDYLVEGGQLGDLVRVLINAEGEPRLHIHRASVLTGILA